MLKKIGIENFKSFSEYTEIIISDLTLLSGVNSAGKSTICQIILLMMQTEDDDEQIEDGEGLKYLLLNGKYVQLGKSSEILNNPEKKFIRMCFFWEDGHSKEYLFLQNEAEGYNSNLYLHKLIVKNEKSELIITKNDDLWNIKAKNSLRFGNFFIFDIIIEILKEKIDNESAIDSFLDIVVFENIKKINFSYGTLRNFTINFEDIKNTIDKELWDFLDHDKLKKNLVKYKVDPDKIEIENFYQFNARKYLMSKSKIKILKPFRGYPQRVYSEITFPNPLEKYKYDCHNKIEYDINIEIQEIKTGTLEAALHYWLVEVFKIADKIEYVSHIKDLATEIFLTIDGKSIPINNVGFGISQVLPIIYKLLLSENSFFIVDEPEIHLHPSLQSKMAHFFLVMSLLGRKIILETHSEYIIDRLIFYKLKYPNLNENVTLYWIRKKDRCSVIDKIKFDDLGYIINSPEGFCDEKQKLVEEISSLRMEKLY